MLREYCRLFRIINALAGTIAVFLSAYVAGTSSWLPVILAAISVFLITASTNAWNDYIDIEIDRINKPQRPLPSGTITPRAALTFSIIGSLLSLVVAAFVNQTTFMIALGSNLLLYLYSWKLKCTVLIGNITVAFIIALCLIFGGIAAGNIQPILILSITVFFSIVAREIIKTMADYEGDSQKNCYTIVVAWGPKISSIFVIIFLLLTAITMLFTYFQENYHPAYLFVILFFMFPIMIYTIITVLKNPEDHILAKLTHLQKYSFFAWFLAVALGAGLAA
jgi:geranylgeranylglycerol-phosphate geranylgeranyltransferase